MFTELKMIMEETVKIIPKGVCGIYCILMTSSGKFYFGSSRDSDLAKKFSVSTSTIYKIIKRNKWRET